jgi:hypothetical protein
MYGEVEWPERHQSVQFAGTCCEHFQFQFQLSPAERAELNRQLNDTVEVGLVRPGYSEFGSPILFVRKADGSLRLCIDYRGLNEVTRKYAYPLPRVDDTHDELKDANFYTHLDLASGFWQVRVRG